MVKSAVAVYLYVHTKMSWEVYKVGHIANDNNSPSNIYITRTKRQHYIQYGGSIYGMNISGESVVNQYEFSRSLSSPVRK